MSLKDMKKSRWCKTSFDEYISSFENLPIPLNSHLIFYSYLILFKT